MRKIALAFASLLTLCATALAQGITFYPQTLPANSFVGRLSPVPGPTTAVPLANLKAALATVTSFTVNAVSDFGADNTGTNDSTSSLQSALNSLSNGGTVYLPAGTYKYSTLTVPSRTCLLGAGMDATVLAQNSATLDSIVIPSLAIDACIENLALIPSVTKVSGDLIHVINAHNILIRDVLTAGAGNNICIALDGGAQQFLYYLEHIELGSCNNTGILIGNSAAVAQDVFLSHVEIGPGSSGCGLGIELIFASGIYITDSAVLQCTNHGFSTFPGASQSVHFVRFNNFLADSNTGGTTNGFAIFDNGGAVDQIQLNNSWGTSNGASGVNINSANADTIVINGGDYGNNGAHGIVLNNGKNVIVNGADLCSNVTDGVAVAAGVSGFQITNNLIGNCGSAVRTPAAGITIAAGSSDQYIVENNRLIGNTTAMTDGGTGTHSRTEGNQNYNPVGVSAVTPGASPWTYTAGHSPETHYISGGTVSNVMVGAQSILYSATVTNVINLEPNETYTITYTVAPTSVIKSVH